MQIGWIALALFAGAVLPIQGAVNALLRNDLGGATFAVGTISSSWRRWRWHHANRGERVIWRGQAHPQWPVIDAMVGLAWWFRRCRLCETVFTAIPAIGAATTAGLTVAGQQVASVFVDKYGWLRLPQRPVSEMRLSGVALLLAGVAAIKLL